MQISFRCPKLICFLKQNREINFSQTINHRVCRNGTLNFAKKLPQVEAQAHPPDA